MESAKGEVFREDPRFRQADREARFSLLLAGLLESQEEQVRRACRRAGLRIAARAVNGDWSILWLRKRHRAAVRPTRRSALPAWSQAW